MSSKGRDPFCEVCQRKDRVLYLLGDDVYLCNECDEVADQVFCSTDSEKALADEARDAYEFAGDGWYPEDSGR